MHDTLVPDDFRSLTQPLSIQLAIDGSPVQVDLTVDSVKALPPHRLRAAPFSLMLRGPPMPMLPQAIYRLQHPHLGTIELFLVPLGQDAGATRYEATFN